MIDYSWYRFDELSRDELYELLALRAAVFVVEQNCAYQDIDGRDQAALHLLAKEGAELVAYLRVLKNQDGSMGFGRVISASRHRGRSLGKQLVGHAIKYLDTHYPTRDINISAQNYLLEFYNHFGLEAQGDVYDEDGLPHIAMVLIR